MAREELVVTAKGLDDAIGCALLRGAVSPVCARTGLSPQRVARILVLAGAGAELLVVGCAGSAPMAGVLQFVRVVAVMVFVVAVAVRVLRSSCRMERALSSSPGETSLLSLEAIELALSVVSWRKRTWLHWAIPILLAGVAFSSIGLVFSLISLLALILFTAAFFCVTTVVRRVPNARRRSVQGGASLEPVAIEVQR